MDFIAGEIKIRIRRDYASQTDSVEVVCSGDDEAIINGFCEAMKTDSHVKQLFNRAVKRANESKRSEQN